MLGQSHSFSNVIERFSAGRIMLTAGYFPRLRAIIYIPVNRSNYWLACYYNHQRNRKLFEVMHKQGCTLRNITRSPKVPNYQIQGAQHKAYMKKASISGRPKAKVSCLRHPVPLEHNPDKGHGQNLKMFWNRYQAAVTSDFVCYKLIAMSRVHNWPLCWHCTLVLKPLHGMVWC